MHVVHGGVGSGTLLAGRTLLGVAVVRACMRMGGGRELGCGLDKTLYHNMVAKLKGYRGKANENVTLNANKNELIEIMSKRRYLK